MRRKFLCAVLSLLMLVTMLPVVTGADDSSGSPTITFEQQTTAAGASEVKVDVKITNNPGFVSATIPVKWDASVMTLKDITLSTDVVAIGWCGMSMTDYATSGTQGIYYLAWNNDTRTEADGGNFTSDGKLCTMEFTVKDTSKDTSCDITANLEAAIANMMNFAMNDLCDNGLTAVSTKVNLKAAESGTEENGAKFVIKDTKTRAGKSIVVPISLVNNPGVWGITLVVEYDNSVLKYTGVEAGDIFAEIMEGAKTDNTVKILINNDEVEDITEDGIIANLSFDVLTDAEVGNYKINASYQHEDVVNVKNEAIDNISIEAATIKIIDIMYGDLNDSGSVNMADLLLMKKIIAGLITEYDLDVADVNFSGSVNMADLLLLKKYIAGLITTFE